MQALPKLPANSVDAIVTDPPYGLEFMGRDATKRAPSMTGAHQALGRTSQGAEGLAKILPKPSTGSANRMTMTPPTESPRGSAPAALTEHDLLLVDALAERMAELLRPALSPSTGLLTAAQLAQALNVSRAWVYENAGRLGRVGRSGVTSGG
jgi:tRNA G10  N-methylase Trm11